MASVSCHLFWVHVQMSCFKRAGQWEILSDCIHADLLDGGMS